MASSAQKGRDLGYSETQPPATDPFKPKQFNYQLGDMQTESIKKEQLKASQPDINFFAFELNARQLLEKLLKPVIDQ